MSILLLHLDGQGAVQFVAIFSNFGPLIACFLIKRSAVDFMIVPQRLFFSEKSVRALSYLLSRICPWSPIITHLPPTCFSMSVQAHTSRILSSPLVVRISSCM
jgi:hypothetical protein